MEEVLLLGKHSKHIPRILRHQVLCALMKKYIPADEISDEPIVAGEERRELPSSPEVEYEPTIQRFHGSLLFVDISGFTALSLKLDVESLKNHINRYFSKMLDIVEKWEGDVIKFAGDALFIVWPTNFENLPGSTGTNSVSRNVSFNTAQNTRLAIAAKRALERAVACGLEISTVCGNYEVRLGEAVAPLESPSIINKFLPSLPFSSFLGGGSKVVPTASTEAESVVYLNVHSGVSCGLMAGIDIIHGNRGEFFLVGDPLTGVAMAESQASKGDVVLDPAAHELLHGDNATAAVTRHLGMTANDSNKVKEAKKEDDEEEVVVQSASCESATKNNVNTLSCGCWRTPNGLFRVSRLLTRISKDRERRKTKGVLKAETLQLRKELDNHHMKIYEEIQYDIEKLYQSANMTIKKELFTFLKTIKENGVEEDADWKNEEKKFGSFMKESIKKHFMEWMETCCAEVTTLHVHEVARFQFKKSGAPRKRLSSFFEMLTESKKTIETMQTSVKCPSEDTGSQSGRITERQLTDSGSDAHLMNSVVVLEEKTKREFQRPSLVQNKSFSTELNNGEIRTVIVMFIKIEKFDLRLRVDTVGKPRTFGHNKFYFLDRTEGEIQADDVLVQRFQACFSVLCKSLSDHGGQLRQFIVDDKGTVCIGTFGLRGSASVDNAAAALEAAKSIIDGLKAQGLSAYIGMTSGKGYCGLVGSSMRHEYAVMGPSTNLSARLMCKAPQHGIICDADTVDRDRTHRFLQLSEVAAKGYSKPVMTFSPVFNHNDDDSGRLLTTKTGRSAHGKHRNLSVFTLKRAVQEATDVLAAVDIATQSNTSATKKMIGLAKTDFYISEVKAKLDVSGNQKSIMTQRLHGRDQHLLAVFTFLFEDCPTDIQQLSFISPVKMVTLLGTAGVGKTAILNAIERKLNHVMRTDHSCNMTIVRCKSSALHRDSPFYAIRIILQKLATSLQKATSHAVEENHHFQVRAINRSPRHNMHTCSLAHENIKDSMTKLWALLPGDCRESCKDLTTFFLSEDKLTDEEFKKISEEKLQVYARSIATLVTAMTGLMKKLVLLMMDDLRVLDKWSAAVVHSIWKESSGVAILSGYCTESDVAKSPVNVQDDSASAFFSIYSDLSRFKLLRLQPLDKESTNAIVSEMLSMTDISKKDLDMVYEVSAGRPLYIAELVNSMSKNQANTSTDKDGATVMVEGQAFPAGLTITLNTNSYRIEEVILYRLDKLHISLQIMLKATAVAVSYGRSLSLALLQHLLADNAYFHSEGDHIKKVNEGLLELLKTEDFLIIKGLEDVDKKQLQLSDLTRAEFDFRIPLEQSSIYNLLVDEQKEFFHEKVALFWYLQLRRKSLTEVPLKDLWEQGFHWDHAALWSRALKSYLLGAKKCKEEKNDLRCAESLLMAYQMFQNLEQEVSMIHMPESCYKLADRMAHFLFDPSPESYHALESNPDLCRALNSARDIFEHDPSSIVDAVDLHVMLAEVNLLKWEDFNETMRILLVAVSLCLTSVWRNPTKALNRSNSNLDSTNARVAAEQNFHSSRSVVSENSVNGEAIYINRTRHLTRRDYLQILSLCAYTTRFTTAETSFVVSFEHSRSLLLSTDYDEYDSGVIDLVLWKLQAETMNVLRLLDNGKVSKAIPIMASVLNVYDAQVHSNLMASHYSVDIVPYTLCVLSQAMIAGKELVEGIRFWHLATEQLAHVSHPYSLVIAVISLLGTVRFTSEYDKLLKYLNAAQVLCSPGFNTLGTRFAQLLKIWLQLGIMQKNGGKMIVGSKEHMDYVALYQDFDSISQEIEAQVSSQSLGHVALATTVSNSSVIEMSLSKLAYIELHGCALERIYVACIGRLWSYADHANIYQLEQRLQSSLQILLQCPTYDYMSIVAKSINLLNCLIQVILTAQTNNGVSAAAIFLAVTERAEQPLLQLIQSLHQKDCVNMAWYISTLSTKLPLHEGIKDQYVSLQSDCMEKVVDAYTDEASQVEFISIAEGIGIDDDVVDAKDHHDRGSFKQKRSRKNSVFYKPS